jgi:PAS domain S-box-containing protein
MSEKSSYHDKGKSGEAVELLREQQEWLRVTLASIGDAVITTDTEGRVTYLNGVARSLTGWELDEAVGKPLDRVFHIINEQTRQTVENPAIRALREGVIIGLANHTLLVAKDGTERPIDDSAAPIQDEHGKVAGIVLIFRDITERREAERLIDNARRFAESVVETVREPLVVLAPDLRVKKANRSFYQTFHVAPEETQDRLIYELGNGQWDIPRLRLLLEEILPQNTSFDGYEVEHDFPAIGQKIMLLNARRLYREGNHTELILLAIEDITERKQAEAAAQASEVRYRRLFESAKDGILILDAHSAKIIDANPFIGELLGYSHADLMGKELWEIGLFNDIEESKSAVRELQEKQYIRYENLPLQAKTGQRNDVEFVSNAYSEDHEQVIQCNIRDITERKRVEDALRASEQRFRALFELGPVAVYSCDASGVIQEFNRRAEELWGRKPKAGDTDERFCGSFKLCRPDGSLMPHEQCPMAEVLSGRIPGAQDAEVLIERPDGSRVTVIVNIAALENERGEVTGALNCFYDITERKQAEELLRESEQRLASLIASSNDAIISMSLDGIIQSWNAAAELLYGYTAQQAVGSPISLIIPADRANEEARIIARLLAGERVEHFETVRVRSDGQPVQVSLTISPIKGAEGRVVGASKIARDISNQKRLEAALREADRRKDEFLAMLGHELRNPLGPIRNALHLIRLSDPEPRREVRHAYDIIERQIENMVRLIDDLLDVARISSGKIQLQKERIDLTAVVIRAIEGARPLIDARRHALQVSLPEAPVPVEADPVRLAQVLWNLLNNAAKYTPEGGRITLEVERHDEAVVKIRDTGMGIAPEMLPRVFDLFTQMERTLDRAEGGLGLGLTLVRRLTEMHGGTVGATSTGQGQGSEFLVRLPLLTDEPPGAGPTKPPEVKRRAAPVSGRRILVVDDNRDSVESLGMLLRLFGNDVRTVQDGRLALEAAAAYCPDVILLDIGLPGLDGLEVCRRLRARTEKGQPLIVALTGYGQEEDRRRSEKAGFDAHMVKPVDLEALQELLSRPDLLRHGTKK